MPSPPPPFRSPQRAAQQVAAQPRSFSDTRVPNPSSNTAATLASPSVPPPTCSATKRPKKIIKKSGYTQLAEGDDADEDYDHDHDERFLMGDVSPRPTGLNGQDYFTHQQDSDSESESLAHRPSSLSSSSQSAERLVGNRRMNSGFSATSADRLDRAEGGLNPPISYAPSLLDGLDEPTHDDMHSPYGDSLVTPTLEYANSVMPVTPLTSAQFLAIIDQVRAAIADGIYPTLITQGSSGSYFCRNRANEIVGVFKPKNEEPYGHLNPKWTKWIHKNMFPCCFGRSCIIPNLGYISEAAASYIDRRLQLHVVPRTEVVYLAAPTFYYSRKDWRSYTRGGELPEKVGSFQVFLKGYKDATTFFREGYESMRRSGSTSMSNSQRPSADHLPRQAQTDTASTPYQWSERAKKEFQWGFERLAILDYLIRNTDRGLDNWMVKYDAALDKVEREADAAPTSIHGDKPDGNHPLPIEDATLESLLLPDPNLADLTFDTGSPPNGVSIDADRGDERDDSLAKGRHTAVPDQTSNLGPRSDDSVPTVVAEPTSILNNSGPEQQQQQQPTSLPIIQVAAIDNGLAFPYKHPDRWRSYPYGWSFLPASRLPFSPETRIHILHLLTSPTWWRETMEGLEKLFRIDADFSERMWKKQRAVVRGEGYNLVECLRRSETGSLGGSPYGLVRRPVVSVFEDEIEDDDDAYDGPVGGPAMGMRPGRRRSFVERQVGGGKRFVKKVKQRFETFARSRPCFENW
ncbi:hypothetical protein PhCBS80983_g03989 [Powellomyces hirtus]|uniref:Phosphatidylinositol 4-kinase n=1 Tax=Powellomyces hirtus TaxID=109895 RepID=A0A507E278_9FUNG|nr:hypothetical protein PhCBS80983_g03989 [Powellomyces hirtus]